MRSTMFRRHRSRSVVVGVGALALGFLTSSPVGAAVASGDDPVALATAIVSAAPLTGAALTVDYPCVVDDPTTTAVDEGSCPTGVGTTPMAGFPTNGSTFGIITSGNAALADDPNSSEGDGEDWNVSASSIGPDAYDNQTVRIDLGAATGNCLAFDFKFLSEEYPEYVNSGFNDAFIAQVNTFAVTTDSSTQTINAPGNFAAGAGDVISVDGAGPSAMTAEQAAGSTYDGSTLPLVARAPVVPGSTNTLYLTIFDQGDGILDSAAFVDNLRYENQAAGLCKSLAVDPFEGTTGVVVTPGTTGTFSPTLSTFTVPLTSNLPTGPIPTNVTATVNFLDFGDVVPRTSARKAQKAQKATTPLGSGSATIPAGGTANLVLTTTPTGVAAVQAAQAQPAALLAQAASAKRQAKKFTKKAKKLKKKAKSASPAKAKKLKKKAKKLTKKAKAAKKSAAELTAQSRTVAGQPLGTAVVTLTNPSNGKSELLRIPIPR